MYICIYIYIHREYIGTMDTPNARPLPPFTTPAAPPSVRWRSYGDPPSAASSFQWPRSPWVKMGGPHGETAIHLMG